MKDIKYGYGKKNTLKKIFCLSGRQTLLVAVPAFALMIYALAEGINAFAADAIFLAASYALILVITWIVRKIPALKKFIRNLSVWDRIRKYRLGRMFLDDLVFRTKIGLYFGTAMNLVYVVVKFVNGVMFGSVWLIVLAVYYLILAVMRYSVIDYERKTGIRKDYRGELKRYRFCGAVLFVMDLVLTVMVILSVHHNEPFEYPGMLIYAMAFYSFYAIIYAVTSLVSFRKHKSPLLSAVKAITLTAAMVSMLSLEIAMTARFGADAPNFRRMMTSLTGGIVCAVVMGMAWYMILHATKEMKKLT